MAEYYDAKALARTKHLYESVCAWASPRGDVTIVGGWMVNELVAQEFAMQSRDVDLVLHSEPALQALAGCMNDWNLIWRSAGRKNVFPDAHFKDEDPLIFRLDVFTTATNPTWEALFGRHGGANVKQAPKRLFPDVQWAILDKLRTAPLRRGVDAIDKRTKDLVDAHRLVFHNRAAVQASALAHATPRDVRTAALPLLSESRACRPQYVDEFDMLAAWLQT